MLRFVHDRSPTPSLPPTRPPGSIGLFPPRPSRAEAAVKARVTASTQTTDVDGPHPVAQRDSITSAAGTTVLGPDIRSDAGIRKLASSLTKLPLGENGRMRVRRMIGQEVRKHPELRPVVRSIGKLKSASNAALVEMCIVTNTLDEARKISRAYLARKAGKPTKRASPMAALASPYNRTSEAESCGLTLIERLFADILSHGARQEADTAATASAEEVEVEEGLFSSPAPPHPPCSSVEKDATTCTSASTTDSSCCSGTSPALTSEPDETIVLPDDFLYGVNKNDSSSSLSRPPSSYIPLVTVDNFDFSSSELLSTINVGNNNNNTEVLLPAAQPGGELKNLYPREQGKEQHQLTSDSVMLEGGGGSSALMRV